MTLYPFSAIVAHDQLQLALELLAVDPHLGGVLIQGEKGTAKTTTVRALAALLPPLHRDNMPQPSPFVELPLNATEDRVVGSIDVETLMASGTAQLNPGLIVDANDGVLYVDEINLLADHLVDVLLDAAASGQLTVERDGVSASAQARFALVGTMNPEEGELRPQLLDRFGLSVTVAAPREAAQRVEIITRRMDFDADPEEFRQRYAAGEAEITERITAARENLHDGVIPRTELRRIAYVCLETEVQGMRADVVMARAAVAHAVLHGRLTVTEKDLRAVASFVLPHRRRRDPFDPTGMSEAQIDAAFDAARQALNEEPEQQQPVAPPAEPSTEPPSSDDDSSGDDDSTGGGGAPAPPPPPPPPQGGGADAPSDLNDSCAPGSDDDSGTTDPTAAADEGSAEQSASGASAGFGLASVDLSKQHTGNATVLRVAGRTQGSRGRRSAAFTASGRAVPVSRNSPGARLDIPTTVRSAVTSSIHTQTTAPMTIKPADLRFSRALGKSGDLVAFLVDTSGSMTARKRLELVAQSVVAVLRDAYVRRDVVAVVTAGGHGAVTALAPTRSVDLAISTLNNAPTGGRTPLAEGLREISSLIHAHRLREPSRRAIVLILTDGRATAGADARRRALDEARALASVPGVFPVVVDCESGRVRLGAAQALARHMQAPCMALEGLTAGGVAELAKTI